MQKSVLLPDVQGDPRAWTTRPVWIADGRRLHCVLWLEHEGASYRMYLVRNELRVYLGQDDSSARVACGKDVVGLVRDPMDDKYHLCPRCAASISPGPRYWSPQLALEEKVRLMQTLESCKTSEGVLWAISKVDTSDEVTCLSHLREVMNRAPHASLRPFQVVPLLGAVTPESNAGDPSIGKIWAASDKYLSSCRDRALLAADARQRNEGARRAEQAKQRLAKQSKFPFAPK